MKAIRVHTTGGPEVLALEDVPAPELKTGQALVRVEAAGVNFIDVYHRTGLYKLPLPLTLGQEGAGVVERVADGVTAVQAGARVAWALGMGAYAEQVALPADRLVPIPDGVTARQAAAAMLQGMTAQYLACATWPLKEGDTCLVHAAAGGVGGLLVQIARLRGARVIATVGSEEKVAIAREAGAHDVIRYRTTDVLAEVQRLTNGRLCDVVYDGIGKDTFATSVACTRPRGLAVAYGNASGPVPPFDLLTLSNGSKYVTRARLADYVATREDLMQRAGDVLGWIASGKLKTRIYKEYALADAAAAHRDLESSKTMGKLMLLPS